MAKKTEDAAQEARFTKEQLLHSMTFREDCDLLAALLTEKTYTAAQVRDMIDKFKKGKVK